MTDISTVSAEEAPLRRSGWRGVPDLVRDVAIASALPWPQAAVGELSVKGAREAAETVIRTTDKDLLFDAVPETLSASGDVESRNEAQSRWVRELKEICRDAASHGWDGEGAEPVQDGAIKYAIALVSELAQGMRFPDDGVDPDGEISLDWRVRGDAFSISISSEVRLSYAGLFGKSDCHGTEWIDGQDPAQVLRQLDRLVFSP